MKKALKILSSSLVIVFAVLFLISCASTRSSTVRSNDGNGNIKGVDKFISERLGGVEKGHAK
jgi:hypothetical protein